MLIVTVMETHTVTKVFVPHAPISDIYVSNNKIVVWDTTPDWGEVTGTSRINGYSNKNDPNVPNASLYEYINPG